jgi:hypothetical protein
MRRQPGEKAQRMIAHSQTHEHQQIMDFMERRIKEESTEIVPQIRRIIEDDKSPEEKLISIHKVMLKNIHYTELMEEVKALVQSVIQE